jgi:hypothetical protein
MPCVGPEEKLPDVSCPMVMSGHTIVWHRPVLIIITYVIKLDKSEWVCSTLNVDPCCMLYRMEQLSSLVGYTILGLLIPHMMIDPDNGTIQPAKRWTSHMIGKLDCVMFLVK